VLLDTEREAVRGFDVQHSAMAKHAVRLPHHGRLIVDMLNQTAGMDEVDAIGREWQAFHIAAKKDDVAQLEFVGELASQEKP